MKETLSFNKDWRFHLGDIPVEEAKLKSPMYIEAKTARKRCGPAAREYMDGTEFYNETNLISHETWLPVNVPHDYIIGQEPKEENNNTLGFFRYENASRIFCHSAGSISSFLRMYSSSSFCCSTG